MMRSLPYLMAVLLLLASPFITSAQKKKKDKEETTTVATTDKSTKAATGITLDKKIYQQAMENKDFGIALNSVYRILAQDSSLIQYEDSMAMLYYYLFDYAKCLRVTNRILEREPGKKTLLEMQAICLKSLGDIEGSLDIYEDIYRNNPNIIYKYQIAELQYNLKRYGECQKTIIEIVNTPNIDSVQIRISINARQFQNVPIKAAAFNMHGMASLDFKEKEKAIESFKKAIELFPNFFLARQNLASIEEKKEK